MKTKNKSFFIFVLVLVGIFANNVFASLENWKDYIWQIDNPKLINFSSEAFIPTILLFLCLTVIGIANIIIFKIKDKKDILSMLIYNTMLYLPISFITLLPTLIGYNDNLYDYRFQFIAGILIVFTIVKAILDGFFVNKLLIKSKVKPVLYAVVANILPALIIPILYPSLDLQAIRPYYADFTTLENLLFLLISFPAISAILYVVSRKIKGEKIHVIISIIALVCALVIPFVLLYNFWDYEYEYLLMPLLILEIVIVSTIEFITEAHLANREFKNTFFKLLLYNCLVNFYICFIFILTVCLYGVMGGIFYV